MGLLSEGHPLTWEETKALANHVRAHGVQQFVHLYRKLEHRKGDVLKWGDEVEYVLVKLDHNNKTAKLSLKADDLLSKLQVRENRGEKNLPSLWRPEYASYMVEGTPGGPYGGDIQQFNQVEVNMRKRREEVQALMDPDERVYSLTAFPRMGCAHFTDPPFDPNPESSVTRSLFWPDEAIFNGHPRFRTLSSNIRQRRGEKVAINVPVFYDAETKDPHSVLVEEHGAEAAKASLPGHVYMDAMGFGMGLSCLQLTFQACHLKEAELLYDKLAPMCPIMLALTASNPILRGYLVDTDCRWDVIAASVDCRTRQERGLETPLTKDKALFGQIDKSRYGSISSYLSDCSFKYDKYNDVPLVIDEDTYKKLRADGINEAMARHVAHLFIRDTVSLFSEKVDQDDTKDTDHFENIQSTNWQTMRFKPPPPNSEIGWRVEFRPCELQFHDFENAAIVCFVVLLTRVILSYGYNLLVPISKVDENMKRAQKRDAVTEEKFYFRTNITTTCHENEADQTPIVEEMTIAEIINGSAEKQFPGLLPLIQDYLRNIEVDTETMCTLSQYWSYIQGKASGEILTNAKFIRNFVCNHPEYKKDSLVSERITYDLLQELSRIESEPILKSLRAGTGDA